MTNSDNKPLLEVENLTVSYTLGAGLFSASKKKFNAVDGVGFKIGRGEIVGLVGESGSGKTTTGRAIIRLAPVSGGKIFYDGTEISSLDERAFMPYRKKIQMVFQDPFNSLNPRMDIFKIISEPLDIHFRQMTKGQKRKRVGELLETVGLEKSHMDRYPHEFSGGQRQRIGIARALAVEPEFIICDEPVSALDVSVQAQIVNLLKKIQRERKLASIFISHDINVVRYISDRIVVMYLGHIVEEAPKDELIHHPKHPYTKSLLVSVPSMNPRERKYRSIRKAETDTG